MLTLPHVSYRTQSVGDVEVFYREAGPADAPVINTILLVITLSWLLNTLYGIVYLDYGESKLFSVK